MNDLFDFRYVFHELCGHMKNKSYLLVELH